MISVRSQPEREAISTSQRLPSLDGWRAFSILLVLGAHCKATVGFPSALNTPFQWLFDGDFGVRTFFLISGFLITWLMLVENNRSGRVNLRHFYARRALRILPVYCAFLLVLASLQFFTDYRQTPEAWAGNLTFTTNYVRHGNWTSTHLWSLAVEEQFYFLWPGIFVVFGIGNRPLRRALLVLAVPILIAPVSRVIAYLDAAPAVLKPLFTVYSFFNYFDSLAIGCACAFLFLRWRELLYPWLAPRPWRVILLALVLIVVPYTLSRWFILGIVTVPLGPTLQACGMALLIMQSLVLPSYGFYPLLNKAIVCQMGVLSYSIYIWQQLFSSKPEVFGLGQVWWMSFPGWLVPVFAVSFVSYYGFERPLFRLRARLRDS